MAADSQLVTSLDAEHFVKQIVWSDRAMRSVGDVGTSRQFGFSVAINHIHRRRVEHGLNLVNIPILG
jgi:hypothetical protein